jgi:hypothetical protein
MAMFMTFGMPRGHGHGPSRPSTGLANTDMRAQPVLDVVESRETIA